jgi:hypothetical protein
VGVAAGNGDVVVMSSAGLMVMANALVAVTWLVSVTWIVKLSEVAPRGLAGDRAGGRV